MAMFNSYVKLPEGTPNFSMWTFYVENPVFFLKIRWKWMMTRGTPISGKFHIWPWLWEDFCWGIYRWYTLRLFQSHSYGKPRYLIGQKQTRRTWHRPMIVQKWLFRCGASAISCGKRPKKNIRFTVVCNPYRVLCCKTRRTNKVAFSLHRMRDLTASPVAVSKSKPVCSHLHCWLRMYLNNKPLRLPWTWERMISHPTPPHPMRSIASHHVLQYWRMISHHTQPHPMRSVASHHVLQ